MALSRRQLLAAGAASAAASLLAACDAARKPPRGPAPAGAAALSLAASSYLHIVAHADDALYFQNPELAQAVASGRPVVTVVLTGGESNGTNGSGHHYWGPPHDRPRFARARMNGLRSAMALLATGDERSAWRLEAATLLPGSGFEVELDTLAAAPQVQLLWLELVEARSVSAPNPLSLKALWVGALDALPTLRPDESPVASTYGYTRDQVVASLTAALDLYRPTVVRTLDPNPEHRVPQPGDWGGGRSFVPPGLRLPVCLDHQDHQYSAFFAQAALRAHWAGARSRPGTVEHYLGYANTWLPSDQDRAATAAKQRALATYGWSDGHHCGDPAGCGDLKVGLRGARDSWSRGVRHRAPGTGDWAQPLADGRLAAFALLRGAAAAWAESGPGSGRWSGPYPVAGGGGLEGQLQVLRLPDGRLRLLGVRTRLAASPAEHGREVVTCLQALVAGAPGGLAFGPWTSLGCPDGTGVRSMEMGYPVAAVDGRGSVRVFVRDWTGGLSACAQRPDGSWGSWSRLAPVPGRLTAAPVPGLMDGLGAARTPDGALHVLGAAPRGVARWVGGGVAEVTGLPAASGPVSAAVTPSGALRVAYRGAGGSVQLADLAGPGAGSPRRYPVPAVGGYGRLALWCGAGRTVLATRDGQGRVALAVGEDVPASWASGSAPLVHAPAVSADSEGRAVAFAVGPDGLLWTARQGAASASSPFGPWQAWGGG